jgi:hypothetical protein
MSPGNVIVNFQDFQADNLMAAPRRLAKYLTMHPDATAYVYDYPFLPRDPNQFAAIWTDAYPALKFLRLPIIQPSGQGTIWDVWAQVPTGATLLLSSRVSSIYTGIPPNFSWKVFSDLGFNVLYQLQFQDVLSLFEANTQ